MTKDTKRDLPIIPFESQEDWEAWLEEHHETSGGLWLKIAKKDSGIDSVSYSEALDVALGYGWIDSQKASFDDKFWLQRIHPSEAEEQVVEGKPREGNRAHRARQDEDRRTQRS